MQRRTFLGAMAAAGAIPGRIRAALIGTKHSHAAGKLQAMLDNPDYEVVGWAESDAAAAPKEPAYQKVRRMTKAEILRDPSIHLVVVECNVWEAIPWGREVIDAGKHLHLEKPPSEKMEPFRGLIEDARRKSLLLQMGYVLRFNETVNAALEAARQGWLGDVYLLRATMNTDIDRQRREEDARYAGGMMFELGGHVIDRVVALWGRPKAVKSWLRHDSSVADKLADNTLAVLEYDRSLAVISTSAKMTASTQHRSFELIGTDGTIWIQPFEPGTKMRVTLRQARGPYQAGAQEIECKPQHRFIGDFRDLARALKADHPLTWSYDYELLLHETLLRAAGHTA